ncbi:MAG: SLC13 family permease [Oscillospiraceae bacterium]
MLLFNPVIVSVIVLCILCLIKTNVLIALLLSALTAGLVAGLPIGEVINTLINGMGGNSQTALSYILLGTFAAVMAQTGLADIMARKISKSIKGKALVLLIILAVVACMSQNLIPVHIAFIPILIPPMLMMMNELKIDRRAAACSLAFGLKAPYIAIPAGFGLIFQGIVADNMTACGMPVATGDVWKSTWFLGLAMLTGLLFALFISYRKPREYKMISIVEESETAEISDKLEPKHYITMVAALATLVVQLLTDSLPLGALAGLAVIFVTGAVKWNEMDKMLNKGIGLMGFVAFVMLVAAGYGAVINSTGAVEVLVEATVAVTGGSKLLAAIAMVLLGLFITMGIGTSFGTVPILTTLYVPLCIALGFSTQATIILIAAAAALGDAGSPASDTTLGPTAGLNADGQHDHIWDTCVPTFLHYNIPLAVFAVAGSLIF